MKTIKSTCSIFFLGYVSVGISALFGWSEEAGLFGAICGIGCYLAYRIDEVQK